MLSIEIPAWRAVSNVKFGRFNKDQKKKSFGVKIKATRKKKQKDKESLWGKSGERKRD